ncbi:MAG: PAS domain-containing protein [Bacilli bacterium]|nr:PAS domain-containing protein [Bacilli bacterium]
MSIKEKYKELISRSLTLADFSDIMELKNQCKAAMNQEYLYLCDILIIDIYINENLLDDALNAALKSLTNIDNVVFQKIYISLLDRIIYVFIHKRNYKSAYRYAFMKRNCLDLENVDDVNRWYLEMAYIYAELNQKDKALLHLKAILNNYPDDNTRSFALSNLTKLYIDQAQVNEAKETLNECISLVYKLEDEEGIVYCEYLNAKLHILEKNYKLARQSFQEIFKNIHAISENYLNIANEYISLLIEMDLYDEAYRISQKYIKEIDASPNLYIKKDFYKNYLKIYILKNKNVRDDLRELLGAIDVLETEIGKMDESILNESIEDDKNIEIANKLKLTITKIEKTLNIINISLLNDNIRDVLLEFSKNLETIINFDEALYVMLTPSEFDIIPELSDTFDQVTVYQYKKKRLYERDFSYNELEGTIIEMMISSNHEIIIDFSDVPLPVKDIITKVPYAEYNVKTLVALPINLDKEIIGCVTFIAYTNVLNEFDAVTNLKIAGKLLERKMISLYYQENIRSRKHILNFCQDNLAEGYFYLKPEIGKMVISENMGAFLGVSARIISQEDYLNLIVPDDAVIYQNSAEFIKEGEPYRSEYRLRINGEDRLILEKGMPYINKDGIVKYYIGIISLLAVERTSYRYSNHEIQEFLERILRKADNNDYKCAFIRIGIYNLHEYDYQLKDKIIAYIYDILSQISGYVYYLQGDSFIIVLEMSDSRLIDKTIKSTLELLTSGFVINEHIISLSVKAGVVRFPKDTYNSQEVLELTKLCLEESVDYQVFNEEIRRKYLKKKAVNVCVGEQLKRGKIELLYQALQSNLTPPRYEIMYNISGLKPEEEIWPHLDSNVLIMFEELAFSTLMKEIEKIDNGNFYFRISCETVDYYIKNNLFTKDETNLYRRIILCLENYSPNFLKLIKKLQDFGFRINVNYQIIKNISLNTLLASGINGMVSYQGETINNRLVMYFNYLGMEYLNDDATPDYQNVIARSGKIYTLRKLLS